MVFSVHNHGFYGVPNTFYQEKIQHFHADRQLVAKKEISIKINLKDVKNAHGLSDANDPSSILGEDTGTLKFLAYQRHKPIQLMLWEQDLRALKYFAFASVDLL